MNYLDIIDVLKTSLPPIFRRIDLDKLTGGVITRAWLSTLPADVPRPPYARFGKYAVYEREKFIKWAEDYYGRFDNSKLSAKIRRITGAEGEAGSGGKGN